MKTRWEREFGSKRKLFEEFNNGCMQKGKFSSCEFNDSDRKNAWKKRGGGK